MGTAIFGVDEKMAAPENSAIIFSQNSLRKIRKKQDNVWVALMENILLVLDTVCRKILQDMRKKKSGKEETAYAGRSQ